MSLEPAAATPRHGPDRPREWFVPIFRVTEKGETGPRHGTKYDMSKGCPKCGCGSVQLTPLMLRRADLPLNRPIAQTFQCILMVNDELASEISRATDRQAGMLPVLEGKTGKPLPWWQLFPQYTLPPFDPATEGVVTEDQCPLCKRDGHYSDTPSDYALAYRLPADERTRLPHLCDTWECFGVSNLVEDPPGAIPRRVMGFATPLTVVSETVGRVLQDASRKVELHPVRFL